MTTSEQAVIATADEAILAKQATVEAGYYHDPYIHKLSGPVVGLGGGDGATRRYQQPIIKRGTHARVACVQRGVSAFLGMQQEGTPQVVVLGAGKDSSFFRHVSGGSTGDEFSKGIRWYEVDYEAVMTSKARAISEQQDIFQSTIQSTNNGYLATYADSKCTCFMIGHDLRDDQLLSKLKDFDCSAPTLLVLECVEMYLPEETSRSLLTSLCQQCSRACLLLYDPILGQDPFGKVMEDHLRRAQVTAFNSSMVRTRTLAQQLEKLVACGFSKAVGCDMWSAYRSLLTDEQRIRANRCEILDEQEEWIMLMQHYCVAVAVNHKELEQMCAVGPSSPVGFKERMCQQLGKL